MGGGTNSTNLFELLYVDIELTAQLGLGMRERRDLVRESSTASRFSVCALALDLVLRLKMLDFRIFVPEYGLEM